MNHQRIRLSLNKAGSIHLAPCADCKMCSPEVSSSHARGNAAIGTNEFEKGATEWKAKASENEG